MMGPEPSRAPASGISGINAVAGVWLIISPWVLGFAGRSTAFWDTLILGIVVLLFALGAMGSRMAMPSWWNVVFGIWLIISPWVLGFGSLPTATANAVILGIIVLIVGLVTASAKGVPSRRTPA